MLRHIQVAPREALAGTEGSGRKSAETGAASTVTPEADNDDVDGSTLFVKNLAWKTGARRLLMLCIHALAAWS